MLLMRLTYPAYHDDSEGHYRQINPAITHTSTKYRGIEVVEQRQVFGRFLAQVQTPTTILDGKLHSAS